MKGRVNPAHRSKAIAAICEELNRRTVLFPGTRLKVHYAVAGAH